ncbi:TetR/AcrR family transcriptional regulator [Brevibacterium aurantiacum]|uniref:TetR/AcrR family transcriptional regulator n=1 Tax=Brevibacterium aurantiacum TaxID=273384 RepID=UPI001865BC0F|nr:TetR/AcrR family transcriptional regulator [Brevibacterium aurantiacum]
MIRSGRPRRLTTAAIVDAGTKLTLPKLTVRGIASELGVSEMSIYRRAGSIQGLRDLVAEGIVERADFALPNLDDPEDALVDLARRLRDFVLTNPGIAEHLTRLSSATPVSVGRIDRSQAEFAERYGISAAQASILVSTIAEHAVALAAVNPRSHSQVRDSTSLSAVVSTVRAGALATAALSPEERFCWSIRATARGMLGMLGLPIRTDTPLSGG